jgi:hypothetical protein
MNLLEKSPRDMTPEELRECYKRMWGWLAEHPESGKIGFFKEHSINDIPINECYACVHAIKLFNQDTGISIFCDHCPCDWDTDASDGLIKCLRGRYGVWARAVDWEVRRDAAKNIRDAWR